MEVARSKTKSEILRERNNMNTQHFEPEISYSPDALPFHLEQVA